MELRVLILAHGELPSEERVRRMHAEHDYIMVTDGAAHRVLEFGVIPDLLCGDFDSVNLESIRELLPDVRIVPTPDQEQADLEKAIQIAREIGDEITIVGATGGRMDHTLANLALLLRFPPDIPLCFVDDFGTVRALTGTQEQPGEITLETEIGDTLSLISFEPQVHVDIEGVQWPLHLSHLLPGTRGVSNVAAETAVTIRVRGGSVFICHLFREQIERHSLRP